MWHRAGTISVTTGSTTVTGVDTGFVSSVRTGDGLQAPDGRFYEIVNVASDTALSITPAYMGPTEAGKEYWIIPVPGYTKGLADQVAQMLRQIGLLPGEVEANTQDIAGLLQSMTENTQAIVSNEGRIANAEQAMLTKIGNLLGLENLKQSQLNLGVIGSLLGVVLNSDNCVIIENEHGLAIRLSPLNIQIAGKYYDYGLGRSWTAYGSSGLYQNEAGSVQYAAPFSSSPLVVARAGSSFNGVMLASSDKDIVAPTTGSPVLRFVSPQNSSQQSVKAHFVAIGYY